jgi:cation transport regulator ChaB
MNRLVVLSIIFMMTRPGSSQAGPFSSEGGEMPKSRRYPITELPGTLQRSCREAQETFLSALADAIRAHGAGDQAHRVAYLALKQKFEKRDDHWIAKDDPPDRGGGRQADQQIQQSAS